MLMQMIDHSKVNLTGACMTLPLALSLFRKQRRAAHYCACHECDLLVAVPRLLEGEQANCPRCGNQLAILPRYPLQRPLVYALTSLIMLLCANVLPFLAINAKGLANSMTLFQAAGVLFDEDYRVLSILVYLCMQLLPMTCLLLICYLYGGYRLLHRPPPLSPQACRWLFRLLPWSMVEVFLVGVLVSLIKIASLAEVSIGHGFWCFVVFCLMYIKSMVHLDKSWMWDLFKGPLRPQHALIEGISARAQGVTPCHGCGALLSVKEHHCPRVGMVFIHARQRASSAVSPCSSPPPFSICPPICCPSWSPSRWAVKPTPLFWAGWCCCGRWAPIRWP